MDKGVKASDKELARLTKRIQGVYDDILSEPQKELEVIKKELDKKMSSPEYLALPKDEQKKVAMEYFDKMSEKRLYIKKLERDLYDAGQLSSAFIQDSLYRTYVINRDFTAQEVLSMYPWHKFDIYDKNAIKVLLEEGNSPYTKIALNNLGKDKQVVKKLQDAMIKGIMSGQTHQQLKKTIQKITKLASWQAKRIAHTESNRVMSQARWETMKEASDMGVNLAKRWNSRMILGGKGATRDSHVDLNDKVVPFEEDFVSKYGYHLKHPGDRNAPASEVINCRCVMTPVVLPPDEEIFDVEGYEEPNDGFNVKLDKDGNIKTYPQLAGFDYDEERTWEDYFDTDQDVNPKYGLSKGYNINCQTCVAAHEANLRGYGSITAMPNLKDDKSAITRLSYDTSLIWKDFRLSKKDYFPDDVEGAVSGFKYLDKTIKDGERYHFAFVWKGDAGGHIITATRNNGVLEFFDPQINQRYIGDDSVKRYFKDLRFRGKKSQGNRAHLWKPRLYRVDNLEFDEDFAKQVFEPK